MLRALLTVLVFAALGIALAFGAHRLLQPRLAALDERLGTVRAELEDARRSLEETLEDTVAREEYDRLAGRLERAEARGQRGSSAARVRAAVTALEVGAWAQAAELLDEVRGGGWELEHLALRLGRELRELSGHELLVNDLDLAGQVVVSAGADGTVRVFDLEGDETLAVLRADGESFVSVAIAADGWTVAAGDEAGRVALWDLRSAALLGNFEVGAGPVRDVALDATGARVATAGSDGVVGLWSRTGERLARWAGHDGEVNGVALAGDRVLSGADDGTVRAWRVGRRDAEAVLLGHEGWIRAVALVGDLAASASDDGTVRVFDLTTGATSSVLEGHTEAVLDVRFLADGHRLLTASDDATIRLWDRHLAEEIEVFRWPGATVERALATPDRSTVVFSTYDEVVRVWSRGGETGRVELETELGEIRAATIRDGLVALGGSLGGVQLIDVGDGPPSGGSGRIQRFDVGVAAVTAIVLAADNSELAVALADRSVVRVRRSDGARLGRYEGFTRPVRRLVYVADETLVAVTEDGEIARLTESGVGERMPGPRTQLLGVALAPDGSRAAWADAAGTVRVRATADGEVLAGARIDRFARVGALALAPAANALFLGLEEGAIARFDLEDERPPLFFVGHQRGVGALVHDAGGGRLFSAGRDRTVRVWDAESGDALLVLSGPRAEVTALAFGGGTLLAGAADGRLYVWPSDPVRLAAWRGLE
ncbi:MAG: WD40 repeat domain-containing protein [Planctomycetota bacterium]